MMETYKSEKRKKNKENYSYARLNHTLPVKCVFSASLSWSLGCYIKYLLLLL